MMATGLNYTKIHASPIAFLVLERYDSELPDVVRPQDPPRGVAQPG